MFSDQKTSIWMNRSFDEGPACGLGGVDHNLTYNYSSSEDSLNDSFSTNLLSDVLQSANRAPPADNSLRRRVVAMAPPPPDNCNVSRRGSGRGAGTTRPAGGSNVELASLMAKVEEEWSKASRFQSDSSSLSNVVELQGLEGGEGGGRDNDNSIDNNNIVPGVGGEEIQKLENLLRGLVGQAEQMNR